jgi:hypothetical protein
MIAEGIGVDRIPEMLDRTISTDQFNSQVIQHSQQKKIQELELKHASQERFINGILNSGFVLPIGVGILALESGFLEEEARTGLIVDIINEAFAGNREAQDWVRNWVISK